ncbi:MAG: relaxase domain-containing protein [Acidimicrobiia bacterium]|nr:relaxase domain-containing protein [Acidimicrobiia bacterium]
MSLGKLAPGQQAYYLDTVAGGAEEYYTGGKEAPGEWVGAAAARLGLVGEVDAAELHAVLTSRDPGSGLRLTRGQGAPSVPGFDATFCAPKSVSLLFALGDPETSNEVRNAHDVAVQRALGALESVAAQARRGKGGLERVRADGFVGAAFRHRTSRAGDPHLHTHVVIANLVHAPGDDRWSALDARPLYCWSKTAGYLYETELRSELTRRLGVAWGPVVNGIADIAGMPEAALRGFSRRRQEIEAHLAERGLVGGRASQIAAYATRSPKHETGVDLVPEWRVQARGLGLDPERLAGVLDRVGPSPVVAVGSDEADVLFRRLASPEGLTAHHATFGRREVIRAIAEAAPPGMGLDGVLELSAAFLASRHVVVLGEPAGLRTSDVIRRRDGTVVAARVDEARWSTPELLATERRLIQGASRRTRARVGIATDESIDEALHARPTLSREQVRLVRYLASSGAGVDVVQGAAGSGKTYALAACREAWETSEHRVIGCALAARAAEQLEDGSGIGSTTIHRLLAVLDDPRRRPLDFHDVVVVDEAAMVGTRQLARLLDKAAEARAKIVLVGDNRQLPEIDAGGAFVGLATRLGSVTLEENRRQVEAWERRALLRLRVGSSDRAIDAYQGHDRIHIDATVDESRRRLVDDWLGARTRRGAAVMLAARHRDVDELNRIARGRLQASGHLDRRDVVVGDRAFAVGDEILATRNDHQLGVLNGTRATVTAIDERSGAMHADTRDGRSVVFPADYTEGGHLRHGYAMTLYKAQGSTVRETFVLATGPTDREFAYTALSRGTDANSLYLVDETDRAVDRHAPELETDAIERLRAGLHTSHAQEMAHDLARVLDRNDAIGIEL